MGRKVLQPRLVAYMADNKSLSYTYSQTKQIALPWAPIVADIKVRLAAFLPVIQMFRLSPPAIIAARMGQCHIYTMYHRIKIVAKALSAKAKRPFLFLLHLLITAEIVCA